MNKSDSTVSVVETFILGKNHDQTLCEDALFIGSDYIAVVDGATNGDAVLPDGRVPGKIAADVLIDAFNHLKGDSDARSAMRFLDGTIRDWYRREGIESVARTNPERRVSASSVIYSIARREIWLLGDCQARIGDIEVTNHKETDVLMEEVRAFVIESERASGKTVTELLDDDTGRTVIRPLIVRQRSFQNTDTGTVYDYNVLDGFLPDDAYIKVESVPPGPVSVVLGSDGYPRLLPTLKETEAHLAELLAEEPLLYSRFKSTKGVYPGNHSFDDRAYIRIMVT